MRKVKCPQCGKNTVYSTENEHRPFCSERCQTLDLGAWADEQYSISSDEAPDIEDSEQKESSESHSSKGLLH